MLTNTDVVDSTSEKNFIQDKSQRPSNAVFAVFVGKKKTLQMTLTLTLQEGKDVFWKTES